MTLSQELIKNFVEITDDSKPVEKQTIINGTVSSIQNGEVFVRIDGSEDETPVRTVSNVIVGDRVKVTITNHTATIDGNLSAPAARNIDLEALGGVVDDQGNTIVQQGNNILQMGNSIIQINTTIEQQNSKIETINSDISTINSTVQTLNSTVATQGSRIETIDSSVSTIDSKVQTLDSTVSTQGSKIETINSDISIINSGFVIKDGVLTGLSKIVVDDLTTNKLNAKYAYIDFANVNFAEINKAKLGELYAESGIIKDVTIKQGYVTGELNGVIINGDLINANTLKADRLVVKGTDGIYYRLNVNALGEAEASKLGPEGQNKLHGENIIAKSVTADRINVTDLVAFGATIGGFQIGNKRINSINNNIILNDDGSFKLGGVSYDATNNKTVIDSSVIIDGGLKSYFDVTADTVSLKANKKFEIKSGTFVVDANNYKLKEDGTVEITGGRIGGFQIGNKRINSINNNIILNDDGSFTLGGVSYNATSKKTVIDGSVVIGSSGKTLSDNLLEKYFDLTSDNISLKANKSLKIKSGTFEVDADNYKLKQDGTVEITKGEIGGFAIESDRITYEKNGDTLLSIIAGDQAQIGYKSADGKQFGRFGWHCGDGSTKGGLVLSDQTNDGVTNKMSLQEKYIEFTSTTPSGNQTITRFGYNPSQGTYIMTPGLSKTLYVDNVKVSLEGHTHNSIESSTVKARVGTQSLYPAVTADSDGQTEMNLGATTYRWNNGYIKQIYGGAKAGDIGTSTYPYDTGYFKHLKKDGENVLVGSDIKPKFDIERYTILSSKEVADYIDESTYKISKSGYYPLAICGHRITGTRGTFCALCTLDMYDRGTEPKIRYRLRNHASSAATITLTVDVLWVKTS